MKIDELIEELEQVKEEHGNLEVEMNVLDPDNFTHTSKNTAKLEIHEACNKITIALFVDTEEKTPNNCIYQIKELEGFSIY